MAFINPSGVMVTLGGLIGFGSHGMIEIFTD